MTSTGSAAAGSHPQPIKRSRPPTELNERLGNAVAELYQLLELYAPPWYTEELHSKAEATLLAMQEANAPTSPPQSKARAFRNLGDGHRRATR